MSRSMNRREFLQSSALTGAAVVAGSSSVFAQKNKSPNEKLNIAIVGVANRGGDNVAGVLHENIVALCDINDDYLGAASQRFPGAKTYNDFRLMLEQKDIDAVVVSTPDHVHAAASLAAMHAGHHLYCEKPLAHTVYETRLVTDTARKLKKVTQMGTQIHATDNYRRVVELVQSGAIGEIKEVHVWCDKVWAGKGGRPTEMPPVPANIHWDLWLGPAPERPYHPTYIPANWRGWWSFGGGTLSDMACHHMDLPTWALKLKYPDTIEAEGPENNSETTPAWLIVKYEYPKRDQMPAVKLTWYNGGKRPHYFADGVLPNWGDGTLFVGEKGFLLADYGRYLLLPEDKFKDFTPPAPSIPKSIGHHEEWIQAIKNNNHETTCKFDYSGPLAEAVSLGNVAYRVGKKLEWDARHLKAKNCPEADEFIQFTPRKGWKI